MRCPVDSHVGNGIEVYSNFLEVVEKFRKFDALPVDIKYEGENLAELMYQKRAKWHKSCHLKFSSSKLTRVETRQKRKLTECTSNDDQRRSKRHLPASEECCLFCSLKSGDKLHQRTTMELDHDLRKMAQDLHDTSLIAKLSAGDLIVIEAKYHYNCLSAYKNHYRSFIRLQHSNVKCEERQLLARAFAELVCYIENKIENDEHILKLSQLHCIYEERLQNLGIGKIINKTKLKGNY